MIEEKGVILYHWPNGHKSVAGGTRTEIKLDRPWQVEVKVDPATCSFCASTRNDIASFKEEGWRLIENSSTPYRVNDGIHRMLIPSACWSIEELRNLGGTDKLRAAFKIIQAEVEKHPDKVLCINFHIGYAAGQTVPHLHFHIVQYLLDGIPDIDFSWMLRCNCRTMEQYQRLILFRSKFGIFVIGGIKAGQCFIIPNEYGQTLPQLSDDLSTLVSLFNRKFRSTQGLMPDYKVSLVMMQGYVLHGLYTPVLNHWGGAEELALYEPNMPIALPWPHEKTIEYLKS